MASADTKGCDTTFGLGRMVKKAAFSIFLTALSSMLQGCMLGQLFAHSTPAWQQKPSYWDVFKFVPEGLTASRAVHNSCAIQLPKEQQCSGHGECRPWRATIGELPGGRTMSFCKCFEHWADPECRTRRRSQTKAYFLSVFLGMFGVDHYYMGSYYTGFAKLASFGGLGFWWVYDIVRIGSAPIYADEFRLAYDLPHWFYVFFTVTFFTGLGYFVFVCLIKAYKFEKAKSRFLRHEEEVLQGHMREEAARHPAESIGMPTLASYPLPYPVPRTEDGGYGAIPQVVKSSGHLNPFSPWAVFKHATTGYQGPPGQYDSRLRPKNPHEFNMKASCAMPDQQFQTYPGGYGY